MNSTTLGTALPIAFPTALPTALPTTIRTAQIPGASAPFISPDVRVCECIRISQECRMIIARAIADCASICEDVGTTLNEAHHVHWQGTASQRFRNDLVSAADSLEQLLSVAQALGTRTGTSTGAW